MSDDRAGKESSPRARNGRVDARRNRSAALVAAARLLRAQRALSMRAVAEAAGVARSTLYRNFASSTELQIAVRQQALDEARTAIERSLRQRRAPLAQLASVVSSLVEVGAQWPLDPPIGPPPEDAVTDAGRSLRPLAERLAAAADLAPTPGGPRLDVATAHLVQVCMCTGWREPQDTRGVAERLLRALTDPLDRGLLLIDADGAVVALNDEARAALGTAAIEPGERAEPPNGGLYEDGAPAPRERHPLSAALRSGETHEGVRGHRSGDGAVRWLSIDVRPLRRAPDAALYGFVAVLIDAGPQRSFERARLRPAGELGAATAPLLDVVRVLDEVPAPLLPDQLVAEATRRAGGPAALYVLDIDGSHLLRLAGREDFPERLKAPLAIGPELAEDGVPDLTAQLAHELPGVVMAPMWLRGRAVGILLALRGSESGLHEVARLGAAALELANGYTDVIDAARRRKDMNPAAEIQQSLIPPRIVRIGTGELAGSVLPSYEVGGDWFDYVENRDGAWIAIADAAGRGPQAGGLGGVALAALRAARRNDATLEQAAQTMHETMCDVGGPEFFLTAIIARWDSIYAVFSWINCGHPPPLLIRADGTADELATKPDLPLGIFDKTRTFHRHQRRLGAGDRLVLYTDGVSRRCTGDTAFGASGIANAAHAAKTTSASATVRAIQDAVVSASEDPLPDDAAVVVLAANVPTARHQAAATAPPTTSTPATPNGAERQPGI